VKVLFAILFALVFTRVATAQLQPDQLAPDNYVKLVLDDSSEFYVNVLGRPLPDRIIVATKYGRLEIPLAHISSVIDYRYNWVQKDDLMRDALRNAADAQKYEVTKFLSQPRMPDVCKLGTKDHNIFVGNRYLFDDSAHVLLSTPYGTLFFKYPDLDYVDNWSGQNDRREEFLSSTYYVVKDPLASQGFILPTAQAFGQDHLFALDYMIAGLQINYGVTDWLSLNAGGALIPFLPTSVTAATGGLKITPLSSGLFCAAAGFQEIYSEVVKTSHIAFPYVEGTYGTWESELTIMGGYAFENNDSLGIHTYPQNSFIGVGGDMRVGENLKLQLELYFISDFGIVPAVASVRYFENNMTIDVAVVFSLYKAGEANLPTLGQYVFNTPFEVIPMVSGSYHF
jgi:hypothetical protein